jgi:hypothetical protein
LIFIAVSYGFLHSLHALARIDNEVFMFISVVVSLIRHERRRPASIFFAVVSARLHTGFRRYAGCQC